MDDEVLVTIVIRSMGRSCLADAIASVEAQQHRPIELLVVDATGGAHPPLPPTPRLSTARLINNGHRLNRPRAANLGLETATGEWIAFLDDDDFLEPTHIRRLLARAAGADRPRLVYGQLWGLDRFHRVVLRRQQGFNPLIMYYNCQISAMSVLLHCSLRDAGYRMDEGLETSEDWDFWLQLIPHTVVGTVSEPTHFYLSEAGTSGTGVGLNRHNNSNHLRFHGSVKDRYSSVRDRLWAEHFARLEEGIALQRAGRVDDALAFYARLLDQFPDEPNTLYLAAHAHAQAGHLHTARLAFQQAIHLNGDAADYRMGLGDICVRLGDLDEARNAYAGALRFNPALREDVDARLARVAQVSGDRVGRMALGDESTSVRNAPCACGSGLRYKACHGRVTSSAAPASADQIDNLLAAARSAACMGSAREARTRYEAIVATNPGVVEAHHALALLAWDARRIPLAEACIQRAAELMPDDPQIIENRARIVATRFEDANAARATDLLVTLPFLMREGDRPAPLAEGTPVHLISPFANPFGGTEQHALEIAAILGPQNPVRLWSTSPVVDASLAAQGVRALRPGHGELPHDGVLVFFGSWQVPPLWVGGCRPSRIIVIHNVDNAPGLHDLVLALHRQLSMPIQLLMPSAPFLARTRVPGCSYPTPIDLARFAPAPLPPAADRPFTIGRLSRNDHAKFHPDEPAMIRRLLAADMGIRIQGGTVLMRHFPPAQPTPGLALLPPGDMEAAAFLRTLDVFYYRTSPHWPEAAGRVVAEAMAVGLPCVCAKSVGFAELIDHGINGYVFDDDDDEEAFGYLKILQGDVGRRRAMGLAARGKAEEVFGPALKARIRRFYVG